MKYTKNTMKKKVSAFTLIEVIIAIFIFGVGVLVCLRAITYFVDIGGQVQKRAQATLLAKEALDIIYNQRDSNNRKWVKWNCAKVSVTDNDDMCELEFEVGKSYIIWFDGDHNYTIQQYDWSELTKSALLTQVKKDDVAFYTHTGIYNQHIVENQRNNFARIVTFSELVDNGKTLDKDKVMKVTVQVSYLPNNFDRKVLLESFIAAWEKTE